MSKKLKSTLAEVIIAINTATDALEAKQLFIDHVSNTKVRDKDMMLDKMNKLTKLIDIQNYACQSLMKFEGLGVN